MICVSHHLKNVVFTPITILTLFLGSAIFADNSSYPQITIQRSILSTRPNLIDYSTSSETPANFDAEARKVRMKAVLDTDSQCPRYESWRTGTSATGDVGLKLSLRFTSPVQPGTMITCSEKAGTEFSISPLSNGKIVPINRRSKSISIFTLPKNTEFDGFEFSSLKLKTNFLNSRMINRGNAIKKPASQFVLNGIYLFKRHLANLAPFADISAPESPILKEKERGFAGIDGINDEKTEGFWRGDTGKSDGTSEIIMRWKKAVSIANVALYIPWNNGKRMPNKIVILAKDPKIGSWRKIVDFKDFNNSKFLGKKLYMFDLGTPALTTRVLKFVITSREKYVELGEIMVLGEPSKNDWLRKENTRQSPVAIIKAHLPDSGKFSLVIDSHDRKRVRNLVGNQDVSLYPRLDHAIEIPWDGLDDNGKVVPPGDYKFKGVFHKPLKATYELSAYQPRTLSAPWVTADQKGGWLSDHHAPTSIAMIGDDIWVGSPLAEAGSTIMQLDSEGRKQWGTRWLDLSGSKFLSAANGYLFVASQGGWRKNMITVTKLDPKTKKFKRVLSLDGGKGKKRRNLAGFAVRGNSAYLAFKNENLIEIRSSDDGKFLKTAKIAAPGALFATKSGIYAVTENKIAFFNPQTGLFTTIIDEPKMQPANLAVAKTGSILVCDQSTNQVRIFSQNGTPIRVLGKAGGRTAGPYDPMVLDHSNAVNVDSKGRVWIAEEGMQPKRLSVWSMSKKPISIVTRIVDFVKGLRVCSMSGKLLMDFIGTGQYACGGSFDPKDSTRYFAEGMEFKLDFKNGTSKLISVYFRDDPESFFSNGKQPLSQLPERAIRSHGKLFLVQDKYWVRPFFWIGVMDEKNRKLRPVAAVGSYKHVAEKLAGRSPSVKPGDEKKYTFLWNDDNGDGKVEQSEISVVKGIFDALNWGSSVDSMLRFHWFDKSTGKCLELAPAKWVDGVPQYSFSNRKSLNIGISPRKYKISFFSIDDSRALINTNPLTCVNQNTGKILWTYPNPYPSNTHDSPLPISGEIQHTLRVEGVVKLDEQRGSLFSLNANKGLRHLFTTDGIYVAPVFRDMRVAPSIEFVNHPKEGMNMIGYSLDDEAFNGTFQRCSDGKIRMACGKNHHSVFEIKGLETLKRFNGRLVVDKAQANLAAKRLTAKLAEMKKKTLRPPLFLRRLRSGEKPWQAKIPLPNIISENDKKLCSAKFAFNSENLIFKAEISDSTPFVNKGTDARMLFKTGDSFNIELGCQRNSLKKSEPAVGDVRLLVASYNGKPVCVAYFYNVPGTKHPVAFTSPWNETLVDKVEILKNAVIRVSRTRNGYVLEGSIPRSDIGLTTIPATLYGDFGVIFSNHSGTKNAYDVFYNSPAHGVTADVPSEIRLNPKFWKKWSIIR